MDAELRAIKDTHDWIYGNEIPVCRKCGRGIIGTHIWGDAEWTAYAVRCDEELSLAATDLAVRRRRYLGQALEKKPDIRDEKLLEAVEDEIEVYK